MVFSAVNLNKISPTHWEITQPIIQSDYGAGTFVLHFNVRFFATKNQNCRNQKYKDCYFHKLDFNRSVPVYYIDLIILTFYIKPLLIAPLFVSPHLVFI